MDDVGRRSQPDGAQQQHGGVDGGGGAVDDEVVVDDGVSEKNKPNFLQACSLNKRTVLPTAVRFQTCDFVHSHSRFRLTFLTFSLTLHPVQLSKTPKILLVYKINARTN